MYKNTIFFSYFSLLRNSCVRIESGTTKMYTQRKRQDLREPFILRSAFTTMLEVNSKHLIISASKFFSNTESSQDTPTFVWDHTHLRFLRASYISDLSLPLNPEPTGTRPAPRATWRLAILLSVLLLSPRSQIFSRYIIFWTPTHLEVILPSGNHPRTSRGVSAVFCLL